MKEMVSFLSVITIIASFVAGIVLYKGLNSAQSAIQEAAISSLAVAVVVIPYVLTRCVEMIKNAQDG